MLVNLHYLNRALPAAAELKIVAPTTAFVRSEVVMPVGTKLTLQADSAPEIAALVIRSVDDAGNDCGFFVRAEGLAAEAKEWWQKLVTTDEDFVFPEGAKTISPVESAIPEPVAVAQDTTRKTITMSGDDLAEVFASGPPEDGDFDKTKETGPKKSKSKAKKKKSKKKAKKKS